MKVLDRVRKVEERIAAYMRSLYRGEELKKRYRVHRSFERVELPIENRRSEAKVIKIENGIVKYLNILDENRLLVEIMLSDKYLRLKIEKGREEEVIGSLGLIGR